MNTARMAAAALRSAADDLGKSGGSCTFDLSLTGRMLAGELEGRDRDTEQFLPADISLKRLSFLILEIAQTLDRRL